MTQQDSRISTHQSDPPSLFNVLLFVIIAALLVGATMLELSKMNRTISENEVRVERTYGVTDVQIHSIFKKGTMTIMDGATSKECQTPWDEDFQKPLVCNINYTIPVQVNP